MSIDRMGMAKPTLDKLMALSARYMANVLATPVADRSENAMRSLNGNRGRLTRWYALAKEQMREQNFIFDSTLFRVVGDFMYCGIDPVTNETLWIDKGNGRLLWIPFYETELEMEFQANDAFADSKFRYRNYTYPQLRPLTIS